MGGIARRLARAAAVALAVVALWMAIAQGRTAMAVEGPQPAEALALDPDAPSALTAAAVATAAEDPARAERLAAAALAVAPMNAEALRTMGLARLAIPADAERGARAMQLAGALGWRDTPTQYWLMDAAARAGDWPTLAQRADALARRRVGRTDVYAVLRTAAADPAGAEAIAARLTLRPTWRREFLGDTALLGDGDDAAMENLYAAMRRAGSPATDEEVAPYLARLVQRGRYAAARRAWVRWDRGGEDGGTAIFDGGFARFAASDGATAPFEWRAVKPEDGTPAGQVSAAADADSGEHYLAAEAYPGAVGPMLRQVLLLAPGRYRLRLDRQADRAESLGAFRWRVACLDGDRSAPPLDFAELGQPRGGWSTVEARFDVPAGCTAQTLTLEARALGMSDGTIARFDNVILARAGN